MSSVIGLFSTPLYVSYLEQGDLEGVLDFAKTCTYSCAQDGDVSYTPGDYIIDKLPKFKKSIIKKVDDYLYNCLKLDPCLGYYFPDSWFVKCTYMASSNQHFHANSLFSGVVYIDSENKGDITFFHPNSTGSTIGSTKTLLSYSDNNIFNLAQWTEKPENSKILIFPSFLEHKIHINNNNEDRYSFAFNILIENYRSNLSTAKVLDR